MNAERLLKLAEHLETDEKPFNFLIWQHCSIGRCVDIWPESWTIKQFEDVYVQTVPTLTETPTQGFTHPTPVSAMLWFDISSHQVDKLFCRPPYSEKYGFIPKTAKHAAQIIRNFVKEQNETVQLY